MRQGSRSESDRPKLRVAFVVAAFPLVSETFIIDQITMLLDRGVDVRIFSFTRGDTTAVSGKYFEYGLAERCTYLDYPLPRLRRFASALPRMARLIRQHPRVLLRALNVARYGREALSLRYVYWAEPFAGERFDVCHCHFGVTARDFVYVRDAAALEAPIVTSFYGIDVSKVFREEPAEYYDRLKTACSLYFVMSEDMKRRVVAFGFPAEKVRVHPVSIDVEAYPYATRSLAPGEPLRLLGVGRFVEKKGFDDLLRALELAKARSERPLRCELVGGGELEEELRELSRRLDLDDVVDFRGYMPIEEVVDLFGRVHVLVQPSKTAANGDME